MAKLDSSIFKRGFNSVKRKVKLRDITAATQFNLPAGAWVTKVYAQNKSTTAINLTVGNAAAGAQYLASTAVPIADTTNGYGVVAALALSPGISKVDSVVYVTGSAYPVKNVKEQGGSITSTKGALDVVIEYEELFGSLDAVNANVNV